MEGNDWSEKNNWFYFLTERPWYIWMFSNAFFVAPMIMPAVQRYVELPVAAATITFLVTFFVSLTVLILMFFAYTLQIALAAIIRVAWLIPLISGTNWTRDLTDPTVLPDVSTLVLAILLSVPILILDLVFGYLYIRLVALVASPFWNRRGKYVIETFLISNAVAVITLTTLVYG